jgi:hypothetical protein
MGANSPLRHGRMGRRENVSLALSISIGRSPRGEMPQPYALLLRVLVRTEFAR